MKNTIEYKGYIGSIEFSEEDMCFYGKVLGIKTLLSYDGLDAKSLLQDFHNAIDEYLSMCATENIEPEKPFKGSFNVRISPELHKRIAEYAINNSISLNSFVEQALLKAVSVG